MPHVDGKPVLARVCCAGARCTASRCTLGKFQSKGRVVAARGWKASPNANALAVIVCCTVSLHTEKIPEQGPDRVGPRSQHR